MDPMTIGLIISAISAGGGMFSDWINSGKQQRAMAQMQRPSMPNFRPPTPAPELGQVDPNYRAMEQATIEQLKKWGNGEGLYSADAAAKSMYDAGKGRLDTSLQEQKRYNDDNMAGRGMLGSGIRQDYNDQAYANYNQGLSDLSAQSENVKLQQTNYNQQVQANALSAILGYTPSTMQSAQQNWQAQNQFLAGQNDFGANNYMQQDQNYWNMMMQGMQPGGNSAMYGALGNMGGYFLAQSLKPKTVTPPGGTGAGRSYATPY